MGSFCAAAPRLCGTLAGLSRDFHPLPPVNWQRSRRFGPKGINSLRDFCGTLLCSSVLDACNGRPAHRFSIHSSLRESNS